MSNEASPTGMIDIDKLKTLVIGALSEPRKTWEAYRAELPDTKTVFLGFTLPLVVGVALVAAVLAFVLGSQGLFGGRSVAMLLRQIVFGSLSGCIGLLLLAYIAQQVARWFGGSGQYNAALAMSTLVTVPALLAGVPGVLPWVGWLLQLAGAVYSLVLLYQAIPVFLEVSNDKRPLHYICTLVLAVIVNMVLGALFVGVGLGVGSGDQASFNEAMEQLRVEMEQQNN